MNRRATLAMATTGLLCLAVGLSASDTFAQQKSLKEQLVGTWTLVSSDQVRPDGTALFSPSLPSPARSAAPNVRIHRLTVNTKSGFGPDARLPQMSGIALRLKGRASALGPCRQCGALDQARALGWPLGFAANRRYSLDECQKFRGLGVGINADSPIFCSGLRWCLPVRALSPHAQVWRSCRSRQVACRRTHRSVRRSLRPFRRSMTCRHPGTARS